MGIVRGPQGGETAGGWGRREGQRAVTLLGKIISRAPSVLCRSIRPHRHHGRHKDTPPTSEHFRSQVRAQLCSASEANT